MAITRTMFSINALATEFCLDRRTVARRIHNIPHARQEGNSKLWYLTDVVSVLAPDTAPEDNADRSIMLDLCSDRLENFEEIHGKPAMEVDLVEFAEIIGQEPETVLNNLRAGMPFKIEGDWHTGEGFTITPYHALDWRVFMTSMCRLWSRGDLASELGL